MPGATMAKKKAGKPGKTPPPKRTILALKGSEEWAAWLSGISERTMIPTSRIVDVALKEWAARNGHPAPPKR